MRGNQKGFTLVEITVVLVLMAIIAAYVVGRSMGTEQINLAGQADKIRNHIRYAQAWAMKRSDKVWGITCDTNQYWFFDTNTATQVRLPGEASDQISLSALGIDNMTGFTLFFDRIGKPYTAYTDETNNTPLANPLPISITAGGQPPRTITIIPETGLAQ
jgi:prepilin-type N-terminal cleavage/methylation domain-containing protein